MKYQDKHLTCHECGNGFTLSAAAQQLGYEIGSRQPERCLGCQSDREQGRRHVRV